MIRIEIWLYCDRECQQLEKHFSMDVPFLPHLGERMYLGAAGSGEVRQINHCYNYDHQFINSQISLTTDFDA